MPLKVVGIGAGGHARVIIEILRIDDRYEIYGLTDKNSEKHGESVFGIKVIYSDEALKGIVDEGVTRFFVGYGGIGDNRQRKSLYELGLKHGLKPVNVIHPSAVISPSAEIGKGVFIGAGAVINASARIGTNVIVNTGAIVEHDCVIGDHGNLATGARLTGAVRVEDGAFIGAGATVIQGLTVGADSVVGAGSVVTRNVPAGAKVAGSPAKAIK
ncbi:MAG: acetyltransferase [Planctomycetota bacterium]|jgi:UDP-perosamine 4-acetyltransferase